MTDTTLQESGAHSQSFAESLIEENGATDEVRDVAGFLYAGTYAAISSISHSR